MIKKYFVRLVLVGVCAALNLGFLVPLPARARSLMPASADAPASCPTPGAQAPVITTQPTERRRMALTFNADAFDAGTTEILDTLRNYKAQATFFLTGTWMRAHPDLVRRMLAEGHQVATQGNTHVDFRELSDAQIRAQLAAAEAELAGLGGAGWPYIRLPSDAFDGRVLRTLCQLGYTYIFRTVDVRDALDEPKSATYVYDRLVSRLSGDDGRGAVVLMHLGKPGTTEALPRVLSTFSEQGYTFMTVQALLRTPDNPPKPRPFNPTTCRMLDLVLCDRE